jgi:hypothetical protein
MGRRSGWATAIAVAVLTSLAMAGCGGGSGPASAPSSDDPAPPAHPAQELKARSAAQARERAALARQAAVGFNRAVAPLNAAIADFNEVAPVHASELSLGGIRSDAASLRVATAGFDAALEKLTFPGPATSQLKELHAANARVLDKLDQAAAERDPARAAKRIGQVSHAASRINASARRLGRTLLRLRAAGSG